MGSVGERQREKKKGNERKKWGNSSSFGKEGLDIYWLGVRVRVRVEGI